ncbi:threonine--tRNA ligase [Spiroplasma chrysopicola]|uniref:Threonine--tRNA ligase n=1 Tax=Spiroplasma chrysopicola DF-1 TaxID=1276227 RepID=R4UIS8_9MOLU|nr:threonine--tRNA ligase [Spiroplasma chrysopicola]AGM25211.1 threonyl-tRNA synthetase [Spiroplasma chrysopicola DF-1]
MIKIILPDGQEKKFQAPLSVEQLASSIAISLGKATWGAIIDGKWYQRDEIITTGGKLELITEKSANAVQLINSSASLLLAHTLQEMYPEIKIAQSELTAEGFYLDFDLTPSIKEGDLVKIEEQFKQNLASHLQGQKLCEPIALGLKRYQDNPYLHELLQNVNQAKICSYQIGDNFYYQPFDFVNFKLIKAFKIMGLAGAYWQNNAKNKMLQRISAISHFSISQFDEMLKELNDRKERDHRKIGKDLEIFTFDNLIGPGLPIWLPNGMALKKIIQEYIREKEWEYDFVEVETPVIGTDEMYKISGHWDHYQENMFPVMERDNEASVLRPMACPHHIAVFNYKQRSYRELPLRIAEHAILHRFESSGSLTGLERVRMMTLTDSHIFVRNSQIKNEFKRCFKLINEVLATFNIKVDYYSLSLRDPNNKEKYYDDDQMWENAEKMLQEALDELAIPYVPMLGEAAFYGPKLDIQIKTVLNHEITVSTLQFDFLLPKKFNLSYINSKGETSSPTIIHRGLIGTYERFIAILLEQTNGVLPLWLAPTQIAIIPVALKASHLEYSQKLQQQFKQLKIRTIVDQRDERLSYKIRDAQTSKIPYQLVIGDKEVEENVITYRQYGNQEQITLPFDQFIIQLNDLIINKK